MEMKLVLLPLAFCLSNSEVWMEFVAAISHSAHLVNRETVINELSLMFFEGGLAILVDTEAEIVLDVRGELNL